MLDIRFIRENPDKVKDACRKKQVDCDIDRLLEIDKKRRELLQEVEKLKAEKNRLSDVILKEPRRGASRATEESLADARTHPDIRRRSFGFRPQDDVKRAKEIKNRIKELEPELDKIEKEFKDLMYQIPNIPLDDVPEGKDENDNKVLREEGKKTKFDFTPKDYMELAENLDIIDTKRAAKVSGARFGYLKGGAAMLEFALIQLAIDILTKEGFIPVIPPVMIKEKPYMGMGRLIPADRDERYYIPKDELYLIGSAEHTLGPIHMDEILQEKDLPKRYVGFSTCFRREAGAYGQDTKGILRVHQFDKIEMFSFCSPDKSNEENEFLLSMQEKIMKILKLPYQVVFVCTGDMGFIDAKQYDIETWMPGQNKYRETHSCSNTTDYQARGIKCRFKKKDNSIEFTHMLNATGLAMGRIIIAIIENYQQKDGSIKVPKVLREYMGGIKGIK